MKMTRMSKQLWLAASMIGVAASCVPRPQPLTLVVTVPPETRPAEIRPPDTRRVEYIPVPAPITRPTPLPHTIQNYDLLEIVTSDSTPATTTDELLRVQPDGTVRLMTAGPIHVAGLGRTAAESAIAEQLQSRQILAHPVVHVWRRQPASSPLAPHGPIAPGDLMHLAVRDLTGPNVTTTIDHRVSEAGELEVPLITTPVKIAGMTDSQAADAVVAAYADRQILAKALLDLTTLEAAPPGVDPLDWPTEPVAPIAVPQR
jgi:protein involved in polysaccharide export with SLBB domain